MVQRVRNQVSPLVSSYAAGRMSKASFEVRSEFFAGVKAELPLLIGVIPFGVTYGVVAIAVGLPIMAALGMSSIVFAGSAQFVGVQLFGATVPVAVLLITTFMVNLRHTLYSASLAPYLERLRLRWKLLLSYLLTDEAYAVTIAHYRQQVALPYRHWYFLGSGLTLWTAWQLSTSVGVFLGAVIPENWPLDFTLTLTFIALVIPMLKDRASTAVAIMAGFIALFTISLPFRLNLILAVIVAVALGVSADRFQQPRR